MKISNNTLFGFLALFAIMGMVGLVTFVYYQDASYKAQIDNSGKGTALDNKGNPTGTTCELGTSVTTKNVAYSKLSSGTSASGTWYAATWDASANQNSAIFSTTVTPTNVGDNMVFYLLNATTYHSGYITKVTPCAASNDIQVPLLANTSLTMTVYNKDGTAALTASGGANNMTLSSGQTANAKITLEAQDKKGTQKMRCVLEESNKTKTDKMELTGLPGVTEAAMPKFYSAAANSATYAYDIDSVEGVDAAEGHIYMAPADGMDLSGSNFKVTCYTYEWFIKSTTGKLTFDIEDGSTMKSIGVYTGTYYID